jgi:hypothetical protein
LDNHWFGGEGAKVTEGEWLAASDPERMVEFAGGTLSDRKLRLFSIACCQRNDHLIQHAIVPENQVHLRNVMRVAEEYADGKVTSDELDDAFWAADRSLFVDSGQPFRDLALREREGGLADVWKKVIDNLYAAAGDCYDLTADQLEEWNAIGVRERRAQADLLRDIFNPFHPDALDPRWVTSDVLGLAQGIYDDRMFDRLPILADALTDAGCNDEAILSHCRSDGPHVRGCWTVDLVLGKGVAAEPLAAPKTARKKRSGGAGRRRPRG